MKKPIGGTIRMLAPLISLAILIIILVALQVRWTGEISRIQRRDLQVRLDEKLESFARDFDREITRLYYSFNVQARGVTPFDLQVLSAEVKNHNTQWLKTSACPQLLKSIWLMTSGSAGTYRFNEKTGEFESAEWNQDLEKLRHHLERWFEEAKKQEVQQQKPLFSPDPLAILTIWESLAESKPVQGHSGGKNWTCLIEYIDPVAIREEMVPDLAQRYLYLNDQPEFYLAIEGKETGNPVLYQSAPGLLSADSRFDATIDIWRLRTEDLVFAPGSWIPEPPPAPVPPLPPPVPGKDNMVPAEQSGITEAETSPPGLSTLRTLSSGAGTGQFRLMVRHRSGSLDDITATGRRNDLALSLGVLFLLAASIILLYLSARQARISARRQREFVAGISHELRTPLSVICAGAENLADGVSSKDEQKVREYGKLIRDEGRRLTGMVEDLLEYSAVGSGRRQYLVQKVDLSQLVRQIIAQTEASIREAGMTLEASIPDQVPLVMGDPEALSRAIRNLISNAVRHGKEGGWIGIELRLSHDSREIMISIADRGPGIPQKDLRRIFLPFERGERAVNKQVRGAGIGLSLVRQIIEQHQGRVTVESDANRGSRFTLHLPLAERSGKG